MRRTLSTLVVLLVGIATPGWCDLLYQGSTSTTSVQWQPGPVYSSYADLYAAQMASGQQSLLTQQSSAVQTSASVAPQTTASSYSSYVAPSVSSYQAPVTFQDLVSQYYGPPAGSTSSYSIPGYAPPPTVYSYYGAPTTSQVVYVPTASQPVASSAPATQPLGVSAPGGFITGGISNPEPGTFLSLLGGVVAIGFLRRRLFKRDQHHA